MYNFEPNCANIVMLYTTEEAFLIHEKKWPAQSTAKNDFIGFIIIPIAGPLYYQSLIL